MGGRGSQDGGGRREDDEEDCLGCNLRPRVRLTPQPLGERGLANARDLPRGLTWGTADSYDTEVLSEEHRSMLHLSIAFSGHRPLLTLCPLVIQSNQGSYRVASQVGEANLPRQWSAHVLNLEPCTAQRFPLGEQSDPKWVRAPPCR